MITSFCLLSKSEMKLSVYHVWRTELESGLRLHKVRRRKNGQPASVSFKVQILVEVRRWIISEQTLVDLSALQQHVSRHSPQNRWYRVRGCLSVPDCCHMLIYVWLIHIYPRLWNLSSKSSSPVMSVIIIIIVKSLLTWKHKCAWEEVPHWNLVEVVASSRWLKSAKCAAIT